jgi:hypothetical protein
MNKSVSLDNIFSKIDNKHWWSFYDKDDTVLVNPIDICDYMNIDRNYHYKNLQNKHYIKIGEECSICLNPINSRSDAFLTDCGHPFHCKCISDNYSINYEYGSNCPLCRQDIGDFSHIKNKYINYGFNIKNRLLDKLEDFWNNINVNIPNKCYYLLNNGDINYRTIHNLGMNKKCRVCKIYREGGDKHKYCFKYLTQFAEIS